MSISEGFIKFENSKQSFSLSNIAPYKALGTFCLGVKKRSIFSNKRVTLTLVIEPVEKQRERERNRNRKRETEGGTERKHIK